MASPLRITQTRVPKSKRGPNRAEHKVQDAFDRNKRKEKLFHDEDEATAYRLKLELRALAIKMAGGEPPTIDVVGEEMLTNLDGVNKPSTLRSKRTVLKSIVKRFGGRDLASISAPELIDFLAELRANDSPRPIKAPVSSRTWSLLNAIFVYGMDCEVIFHNPLDYVPVGKRKKVPTGGPLAMPNAEQVKIMLTRPSRQLRKALAVGLLLGTRVGETMALDRQDYTPADGSFMVWNQRGGDTLKNPQSHRYVPAVEMLAIELEILGNEDKFLSVMGPLLVDDDGERWTYKSLRREFYNFQIEMGWARRKNKKISGHFTLHKLRAAFVALALWSGAPIAAIAAALGHKTPTTTEEAYAYLIAEKHAELATWGVAAPITE
jgi:integrase